MDGWRRKRFEFFSRARQGPPDVDSAAVRQRGSLPSDVDVARTPGRVATSPRGRSVTNASFALPATRARGRSGPGSVRWSAVLLAPTNGAPSRRLREGGFAGRTLTRVPPILGTRSAWSAFERLGFPGFKRHSTGASVSGRKSRGAGCALLVVSASPPPRSWRSLRRPAPPSSPRPWDLATVSRRGVNVGPCFGRPAGR